MRVGTMSVRKVYTHVRPDNNVTIALCDASVDT